MNDADLRLNEELFSQSRMSSEDFAESGFRAPVGVDISDIECGDAFFQAEKKKVMERLDGHILNAHQSEDQSSSLLSSSCLLGDVSILAIDKLEEVIRLDPYLKADAPSGDIEILEGLCREVDVCPEGLLHPEGRTAAVDIACQGSRSFCGIISTLFSSQALAAFFKDSSLSAGTTKT